MPTDPRGGPSILITLETLVVQDPSAPRPLADAAAALERLSWVGRPVVLAGDELLGRRLPTAPDERADWVRTAFRIPDLAVAAFDEPAADRVGDATDHEAVEAWAGVGQTWRAEWLVTARASSVGPARRADLAVVRIGPRGLDAAATIERADHEARDLLDAVSQILASDTFAAGPPH